MDKKKENGGGEVIRLEVVETIADQVARTITDQVARRLNNIKLSPVRGRRMLMLAKLARRRAYIAEAMLSRQDGEKTLILSKATLKAADQLGVSAAELAPVLGVSENFISRMKQGEAVLSGKSFELAALFVRLFSGLDAVTGDPETSRNWMRSENRALRGLPIDLVKSVVGLTRVQAYVDSRRARN